MLGVTNAVLAEGVRADVSNVTVRIAVANYENGHDDCQVFEVKTIAGELGLKVEFEKVYLATNEDLYAVYTRAARSCDMVVDYKSYWHDCKCCVRAAERAIAENPDKLFVLPYGEIGNCPPTSTSLQGKSRKAYGAGLANLVTAIPLAPQSKGHVMSPLRRNAGDTSEITFVAPTSWAGSEGVTCPSASATLAVAAYAYALSGKTATARQLVCLLSRGARLPHHMVGLAEYDAASLERLKQDIARLVTPDATGRQALVTPGVLNVIGLREQFGRKDIGR